MTDIGFNRLAKEQSTYLKQHADNPVHWWSWGPEALQRSKDENKPIFLSIGYSSCHWCQVMGMESFSDEEIAQHLNDNFICIKVDREEHPDLDNYYQQACHLFTQSGGWPLSAFLLPDLRPFFVGTYFPKTQIGEETSFMNLLSELKRAYSEEPKVVEENASKAFAALEEGGIPTDKVEFQGHFPPPNAVMDVLDQFKDSENGGYGQAPKFAQFSFYEWALEQMLEGMITKEQGEHIIKSLERILMGGISDHTRGGIHRYSTDEKWTVPHFEKMLYDQAGYLRVLSKLSLLYPSPLVFDAIFNTLEYLNLEMLDENKFFFSAQGADSEGVEGLYFTFTQEEFEDAVNKADTEELNVSDRIEDIKKWFGITKEGNFNQGLNIVTLDHNHAKEFFSSTNWEIVRVVRKSLLGERKMRIPPMTDNKGVASWNFQILSALSDVMQYCQVTPIKSAASQIFNQLVEGVYKTFLNTNDGGMNIRHTTTKELTLPYLEDYVFFAESQCRIYELSGNDVFKKNFYDTLMFIKDQFLDGDKLLTRAKKAQDHELYPNQNYTSFDQSFKSATSTFIGLMRRAATLFGEVDLLEDIKPLLERVTHEVLKNPAASGEALRSLTYPNEAYKTIKCPRSWLDKDEFANFISYFLPRFTFDYHEDKQEKWEICSIGQTELTGEGFENFVQTLKPNNEVQGE